MTRASDNDKKAKKTGRLAAALRENLRRRKAQQRQGDLKRMELQDKVRFEILESVKRPVSTVADDFEVRDVTAVDVAEDRNVTMSMLFDAGHSLDERILAEQFVD